MAAVAAVRNVLRVRLFLRAARRGNAVNRSFSTTAASEGQQKAASQPGGGALHQRHSLSLVAASPTATQVLAHYFASDLQPADCYLLYGSVGAGKSYFSRAFIRCAAEDPDLPVPSPTFLLQNIYTDHQGPPIHHYDLYRLTQQHDFARLDLHTSFTQAVSLIEWPERLAGSQQQPEGHLAVHISILGQGEQEGLQEQLAQQQQQAAGSTGGGSPGSSAMGGAAGQQQGPQEEASLSSTDDSDDDGSGDVRWRRIQLASDCPRWQPRLQLLWQYLQAAGPQLGCYPESCRHL